MFFSELGTCRKLVTQIRRSQSTASGLKCLMGRSCCSADSSDLNPTPPIRHAAAGPSIDRIAVFQCSVPASGVSICAGSVQQPQTEDAGAASASGLPVELKLHDNSAFTNRHCIAGFCDVDVRAMSRLGFF